MVAWPIGCRCCYSNLLRVHTQNRRHHQCGRAGLPIINLQLQYFIVRNRSSNCVCSRHFCRTTTCPQPSVQQHQPAAPGLRCDLWIGRGGCSRSRWGAVLESGRQIIQKQNYYVDKTLRKLVLLCLMKQTTYVASKEEGGGRREEGGGRREEEDSFGMPQTHGHTAIAQRKEAATATTYKTKQQLRHKSSGCPTFAAATSCDGSCYQ